MSDEKNKIGSMTDLLRSGATLTDLACPACSSPLFRLKNKELWCGQCQKRVIVVKEGEQVEEPKSSPVLSNVEATLLRKIDEINQKMQTENNVEELQKLSTALSNLLENLEKVRKVRKPGA